MIDPNYAIGFLVGTVLGSLVGASCATLAVAIIIKHLPPLTLKRKSGPRRAKGGTLG